jgi:hypothetical protein
MVQIVDECGKRRIALSNAVREPMTARIPGKHSVFGQIQFIHQVHDSPRVLVSPVQQDYCAVGLCDRRPVAIEKLRSIARLKMKFLHAAHWGLAQA